MPHSMRPSLIAVAVFALAAGGAPVAAGAQESPRLIIQAPSEDRAVVYGRAIDSTGRPVVNAQVELVGSGKETVTDVTGLFVLRDIKPGLYVVSAKRLGYEQRLFDVRLIGGEVVQVGLEMELKPQVLEVVRVDERAFKPARLQYTTKFDDFYFRREKGAGVYFDRDQLENAQVRDVYDLMRQVSGVRVVEYGWNKELRMIGCPEPWVYFDGVKTGNGLRGIHDLRLTNVEAVEVYRSRSSLPAEAKGGCGAIFFWFRSSPT